MGDAVRSGRHRRTTRIALAWGLASSLWGACTEPALRPQLRVSIDADAKARALIDDVTAQVEFQDASGGGWRDAGGVRRFEPKVRHVWPLEFTLDPRDVRAGASYQVTVTANDDRKALVATARAVRRFDSEDRWTLSVLFEDSCLRRSQWCPSGETCTMNICVDARSLDGEARPPRLDPGSTEGDGGGPITVDPVPIASDGEDCETVGAVACGGELSRVPLRCEEAATDAGLERVWRAEPQCKDDELCDTTLASALRGMCRPIAPECLGRTKDAVFCDQETMRVCSSMFQSEVRQCVEHARCIDLNKKAICACRNGFIEDANQNCVVATDCAVDNGGCDKLTECTMKQGAPVCGDCPPGFVGDGRNGCSALLAGLRVAAGTLEPAFSPGVSDYTVKVPLLVQRLTITPSVPGAGRIAINGEEVASGSAWTTPILPLGEYLVDLSLTAPASGSVRSYKVMVVRGGAQTAYVKASNTGSGDRFGISIDMDGDTLVVGAVYEDSAATGVNGDQSSQASSDSGAAYVFVRKAGRWEQQAYLKPSDTTAGDVFGTNVAVSGNTIVVGAVRSDIFGLRSGNADKPGAAYVFERKDGSWSGTEKLMSSGSSNGDLLGFGLRIERDTMLIGAPGEAGSGAAYVFVRDGPGGRWREQKRLVPRRPAANSLFGGSAALLGDMAVIGALDDGTELNGAGSATVFERSGVNWVETQHLTPNPPKEGASFGYSVALSDGVLLIGAPRILSVTSFSGASSGEVFAYERVGGAWQQSQLLKSLIARESDSFGSGVALHGNTALIGACGDASGDNGIGAEPSRRDAIYAGAAYLFARQGTKWVSSTYLKASNPDANDSFGFGVALSETTAAVSAVWERSNATGIDGNQQSNALTTAGAVYVFE